ncbi:MAG: hypothetical protein ABI624_19455 [Casimicrobiaceae bacterium]
MANDGRFAVNGRFKNVQRDILVKVAAELQRTPPDTAAAFAIFSAPENITEVYNCIGALNAYYLKEYPPGGTPPISGPTDWPIAMQPPMWGGHRRSGQDGVPKFDPRKTIVVPIVIPAAPTQYANPVLSLNVLEFGSPASAKQASLSRTPGDFTKPLALSQGNLADPSVTIGNEVQPGETVYLNFRFWSVDLNGPSTGPELQGVAYEGGWPN